MNRNDERIGYFAYTTGVDREGNECMMVVSHDPSASGCNPFHWIVNAYKKIFTSAEGIKVLEDLERIANQTKLDAENPNPNTAVWKCAQQSLIQRIKNQISI